MAILDDICRIVKKGKDDSIVNMKIVEFKRNEHIDKLKKIEEQYESILADIENEENADTVIVYEAIKSELETDNPWLLLEPDDFGKKQYPELEFDLTQWRVDNYSELRRAAYESKNQFELQFDGVWNEFVLSVKARFPKE